MQITSTTLRRIIKEELDAVMNEDRAEHVAGIEAKIKRLEAEVERAQERRDAIGFDPAADDPRTSKTYRELGVRIENMEDKLDTLRKQREELSAMEEGSARETPAERKERIAAEKEAKKKLDRARGSYYRHQPPDRPETYPGEFAARYMQEDAMGAVADYDASKKPQGDGVVFDLDAMRDAKARFVELLKDLDADELQTLKDVLTPEHPLYDDVAMANIDLAKARRDTAMNEAEMSGAEKRAAERADQYVAAIAKRKQDKGMSPEEAARQAGRAWYDAYTQELRGR